MKKIVYLLLVISLILGCNEKLPDDIESTRFILNSDMTTILNREEKSYTYRNSNEILNDLKRQRKLTLRYKEILESRGYAHRYNEEVLTFIDEKIEEYSKNVVVSGDESVRHTCNICGKNFVGRGYEEASTGLWVLTKEPYQSFICSRACGAIHSERQVKRYGF